MSEFYLSDLKTKDDLKRIVIERWNYQPAFHVFPKTHFKEETRSKIKNAEIIAEYLGLQILLIELDSKEKTGNIERFLKATEREIITQIPSEIRNDKLYVFSFGNGNWWHFIAIDSYGPRIKLKRFIIESENREKLRTPSQQLDLIKVNPKLDDTLQKVKTKLEYAFSGDILTDDFYRNYKKSVFDKLKSHLLKQKPKIKDPIKNAHLYVHQLLNRIMFLYFVQKKGCFGQNKEFMRTFWNTYRNNFEGKNAFHSKWLNVLFFESLSQPSYLFKDKDYFKKYTGEEDFNQILKNSPYLNGGLFNRNDLDITGYQIDDSYFKDIYDFFESYNFTVQESTPLDQDIAIDPEMLGNIYEMMVNVTEEVDEQHEAGIFYTPKLEIELMIRRSLVEFLFNKTKINKNRLYQFILREKEKQIVPIFPKDDNERILKELDEIKIVDPACGSGHYLIVAAQILYELKEYLYLQNKKTINRFNAKKEIIEKSIFGVDVKEWATQIAKLRLWLELFVDADEKRLKHSAEALLPSLFFKIRIGDGLVQSIGKKLIPLRRLKAPTSQIKERVKQLAQHKNLVYENKYDSKRAIIEEKNILFAILRYSSMKIQKDLHNLSVKMERKEIQPDMFKAVSLQEKDLFTEQYKREQESLKNELKEMELFLKEIKKLDEPPLIWDIGFSDIFSSDNDKNGFDIVIANPPYVRQELIADPKKEHSTIEEKREYKRRLLEQTRHDWDDYRGRLIKIDKTADLYVYFYLKGLQLLNENGIFCYISSNSWLDVGYGKGLQEILLKRVPILAIYDNQAKRSFKHADVNTIIIILAAPKAKDWQDDLKENTIKFISFKKAFEEVFYTEVFTEIEKIAKRKENELFRIRPIEQHQLFLEGLEGEKEKDLGFKKEQIGIYIGNKWGGKYLRAPDIYFTILEKGKNKLVRLGDIAEVRRGFTTGANEFFYLDEKKIDELDIEEEFLRPVIKSPRECKSIIVNTDDLKYRVFMCHKPKKELKGTNALRYIEWGETQKYHKRPTCKNRERWWDLGETKISQALCMMSYNDRHIFWHNNQFLVDARFYDIYSSINSDNLIVSLNSAISFLNIELNGRVNLGGGALDFKVYEAEEINILDPQLLGANKTKNILTEVYKREVNPIFEEFGFDPIKPILEQKPKPLAHRKELDKIVFDELGLTEEERKKVYHAVAGLIQNRLQRARSL